MLTKGMCYKVKTIKSTGFVQYSYYVCLSITELLRIVPTDSRNFLRLESRKLPILERDKLANLGVSFYE